MSMDNDPNLEVDQMGKAVNTMALEQAVERALDVGQRNGQQILNGAQQRLEADENRHRLLTDEKAQLKDVIARRESTLFQLQRLLENDRKNLANIEIEDASVLQSIHTLRTQGIDL